MPLESKMSICNAQCYDQNEPDQPMNKGFSATSDKDCLCFSHLCVWPVWRVPLWCLMPGDSPYYSEVLNWCWFWGLTEQMATYWEPLTDKIHLWAICVVSEGSRGKANYVLTLDWSLSGQSNSFCVTNQILIIMNLLLLECFSPQSSHLSGNCIWLSAFYRWLSTATDGYRSIFTPVSTLQL